MRTSNSATRAVLMEFSLKMLAPTGQSVPAKLVNWGANRWAFKPEFGLSKRWNGWFLDSYAGVWFYTTNPPYFSPPVPKPQSEQPIGSFEGHLSYDVKPRLWFSLDGNFWFGGITSLGGIPNPVTHQTSSRIGATASIPLGPHQSVRSVTTTAPTSDLEETLRVLPSGGSTPGSAGLPGEGSNHRWPAPG